MPACKVWELVKKQFKQLVKCYRGILPGRKHRAGQNRVKELDECRRYLPQLCSDIEPEFLRLGAELESISLRAHDLSEQARRAAYLDGGRKVTDLFLDVRDIFNTSLDALRTTLDESTKAIGDISTIKSKLETLDHGHYALERLALMTRLLGTYIRIESGRLGDIGSNFAFLSEQANNFSDALYGYVSAFEAEAKQALKNIREAETFLGARLEFQRKQYDRVSQEVRNALEIEAAAFSQVAHLSEEIDHFNEGVSREVGEIVSALQFQDITKQQIEHVQAALAEAGEILNGRNPEECNSEELSPFYAHLKVQTAQLHNVKGEIAAAGWNIITALEGIGEKIKEHVNHIASAMGATQDGGNSTLARLGPKMEALGGQLRDGFVLTEELSGVIGNVSGLVERVGSNQTKMDRLRLDMQMLALNALVQAARLGTMGRAVSVLAEDMQHLSASWGDTAAEASSLLQHVVTLAVDLGGKLAGVLERCKSQTAQNRERASSAVPVLQAADESVKTAVLTINESSRVLGDDVTALVSSIHFPEIAIPGLEGVSQKLESLQNEIEKRLPRDAKESLQAISMIGTATGRYTMEKEREVHVNALGQPEPTDVREIDDLKQDKQVSRISEDDLGDNVELF